MESERRAAIVAAVERIISRDGLSAVTMRAVAAEAGVSLRLVQYYGNTKDELVTAALDHLAEKSGERWRDRAQRGAGSAIDLVEAFLVEALPIGPDAREFHRVGVSLEAMAINGPSAAARAYHEHLSDLTARLADDLAAADLSPSTAHLLALEIMGLAHGIGSLVMLGHLAETDASTLIQGYLRRLAAQLAHP